MSLQNKIKHKIDNIRDYLHGGGYPDPLNNAEQISYFFFFILYEKMDKDISEHDKKFKSKFLGSSAINNPVNKIDQSNNLNNEMFKWSYWSNSLTGIKLVNFIRDEVFPFYKNLTKNIQYNFLEDAKLSIIEPVILSQIIELLNELDLNQLDVDTKGDLFEYILKQIKQAGELGQYRTPRHIIEYIVELVNPKIGEKIYDPAVGTAGFLISAYNHIKKINSSENGIREIEIDEKKYLRGIGDKLSKNEFEILSENTLFGNDVDLRMTKLSMMNLFLRNLNKIRITNENALTTSFDKQFRIDNFFPEKGFDVILANPPFSGRIDHQRVVDENRIGKSKSTELLFIKHIFNMLSENGRVGMIVPEGVLFGRNKASIQLKKTLVEEYNLSTIISLPRGVFNPYSGVKTSVIFFSKKNIYKNVLFIDIENDGYKLNSQHNFPIDEDDLPLAKKIILDRDKYYKIWKKDFDNHKEWKEKYFFISKEEIKQTKYLINYNRYKPYYKVIKDNFKSRKKIIVDKTTLVNKFSKDINEL